MEYKIPPWNHQLEAIRRAEALPCFALFFEMGAGKSGTAINILRHKFNERKRVLRTLILAPPIVVRNWKDEWSKHSHLDPARVVPLVGPGKSRLRTFEENAYEAGPAGDPIPRGCVFVTNYEALLMPDLYDAFVRWAPEALIFDESHKLKDSKAKRSKLAERLSNPGPKDPRPRPLVYALSGSPILNSPMDIFQQFLILDGGRTFGRNFFVFRARYFRDKNAGMPKDRYFPKWEVLPGALDEINRAIHTVGMRVTKEECMDLPPLVRVPIKVGMTPEQARLYNEMKRDLITFLDQDRAVTATLAITKALRLQQIASGYVKTSEGEEVSLGTTPKQDALRELLEELTPNHKVLVWAVWKENYEQIRQVCRALGVDFVEVHGEISDGQKALNVRRFNDDPACRVFVGHPGSGGIGINLVVARYSIFYSRTFSLEHSLQAEARNHRGGAEIHDKITRIDLITEGTIDELVEKKLAEKIEIGEKILRDTLSLELKNQET